MMVSDSVRIDTGLGEINNAFPNGIFPTGAIHEFLSGCDEDKASTNGFVAGILSALAGVKGTILWISSSRRIFPPALKHFGLDPDRIIFIDLQKEKDVLKAMNEALKCSALSAVVGELREISFTESRRLQIAVEQSRVTGFILRSNFRNLSTTACVSRWKISTLPSELDNGLPGVGFPKWRVELTRIRNGQPGTWDLVWKNGAFQSAKIGLSDPVFEEQQKAG